MSAGSLVAEDSTFDGNSAGGLFTVPHEAFGGAIHGGGLVVILRSTFSGNNVVALNAQEYGSAIDQLYGELSLTNTTVAGNGPLSTVAAAVRVVDADVSFRHVTFSGNHNAAIDVPEGSADATFSIIANTVGGPSCTGTVTGINSLADDTSCGPIPDTLSGLDTTLADHGGPTQTHALLEGSNAVDGAGLCATASDQRGAPRVGLCDIGAYEYLGCPVLTLDYTSIATEEAYEDCAIVGGPGLTVLAPDGDVTFVYGHSVTLRDGFSVETGARLAIIEDPSLEIVLPALVEADRARRAGLRKAVRSRLDSKSPDEHRPIDD